MARRAAGRKVRPRRGFESARAPPFAQSVVDAGQEGPPTRGSVPGPTQGELRARDRTSGAIRALLNLAPKTAMRVGEDGADALLAEALTASQHPRA